MRVKIRFIQRLFIPPSLLAGFIGLSLGPHGFGIIPLSTQSGTYAGILIAFIFGALPLTSQKAAKGAGNIDEIVKDAKFDFELDGIRQSLICRLELIQPSILQAQDREVKEDNDDVHGDEAPKHAAA